MSRKGGGGRGIEKRKRKREEKGEVQLSNESKKNCYHCTVLYCTAQYCTILSVLCSALRWYTYRMIHALFTLCGPGPVEHVQVGVSGSRVRTVQMSVVKEHVWHVRSVT